MTPEELSKYPTEVLKGTLIILEAQEKNKEDENNYLDRKVSEINNILGVNSIEEGIEKLKTIKKKKIEALSKLPDDVLEMAIKIKEKELEESKCN